MVLGALVLAAVGGWMIGSRPLGDELAGPSPAVTPANEIEALLVRERQLLLRGLYLIEMTDGG